MSIVKKIVWTGLLSLAGVVLYRFARIVVQAVRDEFPAKRPKRV